MARVRDNLTMIVVFLVASTACLFMASAVLNRTATRFDLTATRAHHLSDRSASIIAAMPPGEWELVLATRTGALDPRDASDINDVLRVFAQNPSIARTVIDTGAAEGAARYTDLLARLAERERAEIDAQSGTITRALGTLSMVSDRSESLSDALLAVRDAVPTSDPGADANIKFFTDRAAAARVLGADLLRVLDTVRPLLDESQAPPVAGVVRVARVDLAAQALRQPLDATSEQLRTLSEQLARFAGARSLDEDARARARDLVAPVRELAGEVAAARDSVERLETPDLLKVERALSSGEAMLVIGPPAAGVTAIDLSALFPDRVVLDRLGLAGADVRRRAEELVATAIGSLSRTDPPIVVFVHAEPQRFIEDQPVFKNITNRLTLRGIDTLEWACAIEPTPPSTNALDPLGVRPVVFVTLAPDAGAGSPVVNGVADQTLSGPARTRRYADTLLALVEQGESVLMSLNPSPMPTFGETDPQNQVLARFGLTADTGKPVLVERRTEDRALADPDVPVTPDPDPTGPAPEIARAITGLRLTMPWAVAIERTSDTGAATELVSLDSDSAWAESEWQRLWHTPRPNRPLLSDQPTYDATRDTKRETYPLAWAVETGTGDDTRRFVVVGSNAWHIDPVTTQAVEVDGRVSPVNPGAPELFEAAVYWLARQDELIARSARAGSVPRIAPISGELLGPLRLLLALGPAALVILLGLTLRLVRG